MAEDGSSKGSMVGRRDALKLASAVSALGIGLGVVLEAGDANAETIKIPAARLGKLSIKLFKFDADKNGDTLVRTFDLAALLGQTRNGGSYSIKIYNQKPGDDAEVMAANEIQVVADKR